MGFVTVDPVTGSSLQEYSYSTSEELRRALTRLHAGFLKWKKLRLPERQRGLSKLAVAMKAERQSLALLMTGEMGKPITDSLAEVDKCIRTVETAVAEDLSFLNSRTVSSVYSHSEISHEPLGIIYGVMPWNYPLWQLIRMAVPALLAGNTVLLKHSEITPLTGRKIEELFKSVFEESVLLNLPLSHEMTDMVMSHPSVGGISLTGSVTAGHKVYQSAASFLKKTVLELGGSDSYLVLNDADLGVAARKITKSRLLNNGQSCIACKRALVSKDVLTEFLELLKKEFSHYRIGNPREDATALGPLAHPRFKKSLKKQLQELQSQTGAKRIFSLPHGQSEESAFVDPEIYLLEKNSSWLRNQEIFAPVLLVIPFETEDEAVEIANATDFALGAAVFSKETERASLLAQRILAGQVVVNDIVISDLSLPFGGFKQSGLGRELGRESFFEFTQTKVISS